MTLAFHACPPPGEWLNDPNGLVHADGEWRLFVQHRADAPAFRATGWARLSSHDLLDWHWDGPVIAAEADDWAYSGSVTPSSDGFAATHTVHDAATGLERQVRRTSRDAGATWSAAVPIGGAANNTRDPFVFDDGAALLLARPCDWHDPTIASHLAVWRVHADGWRETGRIGPWHPPGVMWEVPVVIRVDGRDVLLISTVDRRGDGADCAVHAWIGTLGADGFVRDDDGDPFGQRLDLGPDFYAAMSAAGTPLIVAWLSSWATARDIPWPGFAGGAISLPRRLSLSGGRVRQRIEANIADAFTRPLAAVPTAGLGSAEFDGTAGFRLSITGTGATATIFGDPATGALSVERGGVPPIAWQRRHVAVIARAARRRVTIVVDGPAVEVFIDPDNIAASIVVPVGSATFAVALTVAAASQVIEWRGLSR